MDLKDRKIEESECKRKWRERLRINWKLAPLKLLMLLMFGAMSSLYPYMTVHMMSLGITRTEAALIYAILPFVCFIGPPVGGALADRIGNYRLVFVGYTLFCVLTHLMMWFGVPSAMPQTHITTSAFPRVAIIRLACWNSSKPVITESFPANQSCSTEKSNSSEVTFHGCTTDCYEAIRPMVCLANSTGLSQDCSDYEDFSGRYLQGGHAQFENGTAIFTNFTAEEGLPVGRFYCEPPASSPNVTCSVFCGLETRQKLICAQIIPPENRVKTIAWYVVWRFLAGIGMNTISPILDAIAYQMSKEHKGDLGFQRMFSLVGMCTLPPISGYFVDLASMGKVNSDFSPAFYLFGSLLTISAVIAYFMALKVRMPAENIAKNLGKILSRPKVAVFVLMMFFTGGMWGFLENFLFVFMEELRTPAGLKTPRWLMGMTGTVSAISAIPVVAASTFIMRYLGHAKIVMITCILYGFRFLSYSFIYNPFHILPVEVLEAFTTSLLWVVASVYCGKIAPDYLATLQGVMGAAHAAIGRGMGSLVGGIMFEYLKSSRTYQIFAVFCFCCALFYAVLHYAWLRRLRHPRKLSINPAVDYKPENEEPAVNFLTPAEEKDLEQFAEGEALLQSIGETRPLARIDMTNHQTANNGLHARFKDHKA